jgi:hypothetical protein
VNVRAGERMATTERSGALKRRVGRRGGVGGRGGGGGVEAGSTGGGEQARAELDTRRIQNNGRLSPLRRNRGAVVK